MELTEVEKMTLEIFTSDAGAYDTVYKIAKDKIGRAKDVFIRNLSVKKDIPNDEIGAKIRAFDEGMLLVDSVFRDIGQYKKRPKEVELNPAR